MSLDSSKRPLKLVFIGSDPNTAKTLKKDFADKGVRPVGEAPDLKTGLRVLRGLHPDVVLLELQTESEDALEGVRRIRAELPDCGIILSSNQMSPELILNSMRAGAQEFVGRPAQVAELDKAFEHLRKLLGQMAPANRRRSSTIAVFGAKGGVGSSLIAANLAVALAHRPGIRVALLDLNFQMGDMSLMLDLKPRYSLADLQGSSAPDERQVRSLLSAHGSGVLLLAATTTAEDDQKVDRNRLVETFGLLGTMFDWVIVDADRRLDDRTLEVLDLADRVLLVSTLSLPVIRNTKRYLELFHRLDMDESKFQLVVNRFNNKKSGLRIRDLEDTVGLQVSWLVPNDYQVANQSVDAGVPLLVGSPRSKIAKNFEEYAERLVPTVQSRGESTPVHLPVG